MIDINRRDYYQHDQPEGRTRERLKEMKELGMEEVGYGEFGIKGVTSGLFIEKVWNYNDVDWLLYINWVKDMKQKNGSH